MVDISVLITCFYKEQYLDECVSSILRQTELPKEILILHDGCDEPMHHAQATSIMLKSNIGVARARHEVFRYSTGKLVLFLDGDDMLSPDYLEKMLRVLNDKGDCIVYPDIYAFADPGSYKSHLTISLDDYSPSKIKELRKFPIPISCLMKREVYESVGGFKDYPVLEDLDFWLSAMCNGYTFSKAQTLLWYRQEGPRRHAVEISKRVRVLEEILDQFVFEDDKILRKGGNNG